MNKVAKNPKVSILVPIYNVEQYLPACLDSLVGQTLRNIEIICINDGSTDLSLKIIKKYAANDPRIIILNKKNTGYGDSMNKGLAKATGEYIGIVESDDWAEPNMFEELYNMAVANEKPDIVKSNFYHYYSKTEKNEKCLIVPEHDDGKVVDPFDSPYIFYAKPSIWSAIYRQNFLSKHGIRFLPTPGASYQDIGFTIKNYVSAQRVLLTSKAFLHYRLDNEDSSVNNVDKKAHCAMDEYSEVERFLRQKNLQEKYRSLVDRLKFDNYYWTFSKLSPALAENYLIKMAREFTIGELDLSHFDDERAEILQQILADPKRYYGKRHILAAKRKIKRILRKLLYIISPTYRKLYHINRELDMIRLHNRALHNKILKYEKRKEQQSI